MYMHLPLFTYISPSTRVHTHPHLTIQAVELVEGCGGLRRAKDLAIVQAEQAMEAALGMAASPARDGLIKLAALVIQRTS